jgi:hypothetical protein
MKSRRAQVQALNDHRSPSDPKVRLADVKPLFAMTHEL